MGLLNTVGNAKVNTAVDCGKYTVAILSYDDVEAQVKVNESDGSTIETKPYVMFKLAVEGYADQYVRMYEKSLEIMFRELGNAYFKGQSMSGVEMLEQLAGVKIPATKYKTVGNNGTAFYNWSFNPDFVVKVTSAEDLQ